jgi:nitrogenase molybdenum-iron protein alpha/beta subunit
MEIARALIDKDVVPVPDTVNIVAEKSETNARAESLRGITEILDRLGITINCHFICETPVEAIRHFKRGKLNILAYGDYMGRTIRSFLESEFQAEFFDYPFPIGFRETCEWVRRIGEYFHRAPEETEAILSDYQKQYQEEINRIKPQLAGKRVMVITYNQDIDWILQTAIEIEMEISFVGIMNFSQDNLFKTNLQDRIGELHIAYENSSRQADLDRIRPDLLLTNYGSNGDEGALYRDTIPLSPTAGFFSGLLLAKRWGEIFKMNLQEGWRQDELLFRKYYA